jgi:hypothetical protein
MRVAGAEKALIYLSPVRILPCSWLFSAILIACTVPLYAGGGSPADARWMDLDGISVPVPPAEHPRLFLRARDLGDLKRRTTHPVLKPVWEEMQEVAKENAQTRLEVDALRYLLTRDKELGTRTVAAALEALQKAQFDPHGQDVTRPIGRMMVTGSVVYDWCYPLISADQKKAFLDAFLRLAKQLECSYPPKDFGWVTGHGSEWMVMRDMLSAGIALYDEFPEMYRYASSIFFKKLLPARNWWYPGHAFHQGTAYSETRFVSDMYPLWIFDRLGAGNVFNPSQQFVPYQWIYIRRPDGQLLRAGDGQNRPPKLRSLLCASYYGDGYVLSDYLKEPGINKTDKIFEFLWRDPDLKPLPLADLPLSRYMGSPYGWMVARTGWGEDSAVAEMKMNVYNFGNHQHQDAGAFQLYYRGLLAMDSGLYEGVNGAYGSPHHENYSKRAIAHNTLLIYDPSETFLNNRRQELKNDGGQRLQNGWREPKVLEDLLTKGYKTGSVLGHGFGPDPIKPEYTYLEGDLTEAYSAKVNEVKRSFVFLNLGGTVPAAMVVFDRVVAANPDFKKFWLLHSMEEPKIDGDTSVVTLSERGWTGRLVNRTLLPEAANAEISKIGGPGKEYWIFGENFPNAPRPGRPVGEFELGSWRVELSPKKSSATDCFLNVMQVMDGKTGQALASERIQARDFTGVKIADRVVLFNTTGRRTGLPVSFASTGAGKLKYLVAGLTDGTWQVWRDGRIVIPAQTVSADSGTLYFEGPAGRYELRR